MKVSSPFHIPIVAGVCLLIFAATAAQAANTWDGGGVDSNWGTATNWDNDVVPGANQALTFAGSTGLASVNNTVSRQVNGFTFAAGAGAFTLSGSAITLAGNITNSSANTQTINLNMATSTVRTINLSNNAVTLGGVISGLGGFKTDPTQNGTITLSGSNSFTGGVSLNVNSSVTQNLNISHEKALGTGLFTWNVGSTATSYLDNTSNAAMTIANDVRLTSTGRMRFAGSDDLTFTGTITNTANRRIQVDAGTVTFAGSNFFLSDISGTGYNLQPEGAGNLTIEGVVSNFNGAGTAGGIQKYGSGTLTLSGTANTYTGATKFEAASAGVMVVTKLADGGTASSIGKSSNDAANLGITLNAGTGVLRYIGSGDDTDRLFSVANSNVIFTIESSGDGALNFTNTGAMVANAGSGGKTLVLGGTYTGTNLMAVKLTATSGALALRKEGAGTWNLTNTNDYTNATTVNAGTLLVSGAGSINSTSGITVNNIGSKFNYTSSTGLTRNVTLDSGGGFYHNGSTDYTGTLTWTNGVLGGTNWNGSKLGARTVGTNQILSPGNSVGTATTTSQTWASLGAFNFEVNKANGTAGLTAGGWDLLNLSSTLSITATSGSQFTINLISLGLDNLPGATNSFSNSTDYQWLFADATGAITGFSADKFAIDTSGFTNPFTGTFGVALGNEPGIGGDNSQLYLTYTIPEPNTALLLGFGLSTLLLRRRRK